MDKTFAVWALVAVMACGGDDDGGDAGLDAGVADAEAPDGGDGPIEGPTDGGPEAEPPQVSVTFPSAASSVSGDLLVITGSAEDASGVDEVRVDGVLADTDDGFATWRATVSVEAGGNTVLVEADDSLGNRGTTEVILDRTSPLLGPRGGQIQGEFAYVVDFTRLVRIELDTGIVVELATLEPFSRVISPTETQVDAYNLALDLDRDRIFIANSSTSDGAGPGVWAYSLMSGEWSELSGSGAGSGPAFAMPQELILDPLRNRLVVHDTNVGALIAVSLDDGARSILASDDIYRRTCDLEMDVGIDRLLVTCNRIRAATLVAWVDPSSGVHTIVSQVGSVGGGTNLDATAMTRVGRAAAGGPLWLWADRTGLLTIDEGSGDRNLVASTSVIGTTLTGDLEFAGERPVLVGRDGLRWDDPATIPLWSDSYPPALSDFRTDDFVAAGSHTWVFGGVDARWVTDGAIAGGFDVEDGFEIEALASDGSSAVLALISLAGDDWRFERLDLTSGERVTLPDPAEVRPQSPRTMALDESGDRMFLVLDGDTEPVVVEVALDTGVARTLPDSADFPLVDPSGLAFDRRNGRLLVADEDYTHLVAVNLSDGARTAFATPGDPGPPLPFVLDVAVDAEGRIWALADTLFEVGDDGARRSTGIEADQVRAGDAVVFRRSRAAYQLEPGSGDVALRAGSAEASD